MQFISLSCHQLVSVRSEQRTATSELRLAVLLVLRPIYPKDKKTLVWMGRCRGYFGVIYWDMWCYQTGHMVSSDGTRGVIRQDIWCHCTGHVMSSDGGTRWRSWLTALQAARSWVLFPMVSLEFFIHIILLVALWFQTEMSKRNISWGVKVAGA
jgi:hypothetical protein